MEDFCGDRLDKRRRAFLGAARRLFIEKGFDDTSLADVVAEAGGSLATLYKLFGNKAGLLFAVVEDRTLSADALIAEIGDACPSPRTALLKIGEAIRERYFDDEGVAISRVVIAYSLKDRQFAADFHRKTVLQSQVALIDLFEKWIATGVVVAGQPRMLAQMFLGMFIQELYVNAISHGSVGAAEFPDLEFRVDFFCRGAGLTD
ncbi:AcrR family transcriptional regulator [Altererythrobacter atlanticus]|uniref:TetR family regulatory protein n=1 Tax=Croceibacterium atlanticum TaxID=1267766 RepID=A0A0F7KVQ6_9SPHN|nr:TetR/AcrR family transcriptional regulator [Croceibacterium atlanticum]AKH42865.1 TetR family regulatory protein [Croceibacterium atlanticum]MBB5731645.1 AcrR family transcriptional regulator [Croceibacterium atlanticum]